MYMLTADTPINQYLINSGTILFIQAHYSISKAANWLGFGLDNVVKVSTDKNGAMIVSDLEKCIQNVRLEGKCPLIVNATAGTTVLGAFDDLEEISKVQTV